MNIVSLAFAEIAGCRWQLLRPIVIPNGRTVFVERRQSTNSLFLFSFRFVFLFFFSRLTLLQMRNSIRFCSHRFVKLNWTNSFSSRSLFGLCLFWVGFRFGWFNTLSSVLFLLFLNSDSRAQTSHGFISLSLSRINHEILLSIFDIKFVDAFSVKKKNAIIYQMHFDSYSSCRFLIILSSLSRKQSSSTQEWKGNSNECVE